MNYIIEVGHPMQCCIEGTHEPVDNVNVFATFTKAKETYISILVASKKQWQEAISEAKKLRKKDVEYFIHAYK